MAQPIIQSSFSKGELSPTLYSRTDLAAYKTGAALLRNFFVDYRGGASTRPGTQFVARARLTPDSTPVTKTVFITDTSLTEWTVPSDLVSFDKVWALGGGNGAQSQGNGGGGTAYSEINSFSALPGSVVGVKVGKGAVGNTGVHTDVDTWFGDPTILLAQGAGEGNVFNYLPGTASGSVGDLKFDGGTGAIATGQGGCGGGGAAGPDGPGANGGAGPITLAFFQVSSGAGGGAGNAGSAGSSYTGSSLGANGGNNSSGSGAGIGSTIPGVAGGDGTDGAGGGGGYGSGTSGGPYNVTNAGDGGPGSLWTDDDGNVAGPGGGGGAASSGFTVSGPQPGNGGHGGLYGAGGGSSMASSGASGDGADGMIGVRYFAAPPPPPEPTVVCSTYSGTSNAVRLIPFQFSTEQAYCLEFGQEYMRVIRDGGLVLEPSFAVDGASQTDPIVITASGNDFANGDWVFFSDVVGMTELNDKFFIVESAPGSTFTLTDLDGNVINAMTYGAYVSGGTVARVFTLATPYLSADLALLKFTQSADVMTLTHPSYAPRDLTRTQHYAWTLTVITFAATIQAPVIVGTVAQNQVSGMNPLFYRYQVTSKSDSTGEESIGSLASSIFANTALDQTKGCQNLIAWDIPSGPVPDRYFVYKATPVGPVDVTTDPSEAASAETVFGYIGSSRSNRFIDANIGSDFTRSPPEHRNPFANGAIDDIEVISGGTAYYDGRFGGAHDTISITDATGSGWTGFLNIGPSGVIESVTVTDPGENYTMSPTIVIGTSTGSGASLVATIGARTGNYPGVVCYFQQRKTFASTFNAPETFWMSQTGAFKNFDVSVPVRDSDAITGTLASTQVNAIQFLVPMQSGLIALTDAGAWQISGGSPGAAITPTTITAQPQGFIGSNHFMPPIPINDDILFTQLQGATVRDLTYNFYTNIYSGTDLTVFSSHLFTGYQLVEWTWAEAPFKLVWAVRNDGSLLSMTYLKEQEVIGWTHHDTNGCFQSICSIPEGDEQAVYLAVERRIPGVNSGDPVIYIERMASRNFYLDGVPDASLPWCVDSGLRYDGTPATVISGLEHLEGSEVVALADGGVVGPYTVTDGTITLAAAASIVTVGLAYTCQLKTLRLDLGSPTIQDKYKQITRCTLRLVDSRGLKAGPSFDDLIPYKERTPLIPYSTAIPLITDDEGMPIPTKWDRAGQICVQQDYPLPATITGVIQWTEIGGG